jgi:hypothetical protein
MFKEVEDDFALSTAALGPAEPSLLPGGLAQNRTDQDLSRFAPSIRTLVIDPSYKEPGVTADTSAAFPLGESLLSGEVGDEQFGASAAQAKGAISAIPAITGKRTILNSPPLVPICPHSSERITLR